MDARQVQTRVIQEVITNHKNYPKLKKLYRERCLEVADTIAKRPKRSSKWIETKGKESGLRVFNQKHWTRERHRVHADEKNDCETPCCIAGYTCEHAILNGYWDYHSIGHMKQEWIPEMAKFYLGLNWFQTAALFFMNAGVTPSPFVNSVDYVDKVMPAEAAHALRTLSENGIPDWGKWNPKVYGIREGTSL